MKSRTSCFKAALKKDMTRFAPAWILYTLCMFLGLLLMAEGDTDLKLSLAMAECIQIMAPVNLCYGLVTAQLLFGDLFSSRLCFGLHTLPLRREGWFAAHALSGILFSLIPTALMTGVSLPLLLRGTMENGWQIGLYWLLGTNLEYLFFFGIGIFSMLLSGNRIGSAVVYALLNFAAILGYFVAESLYTPMLFGAVTDPYKFYPFSPVTQMVEFNFISTETVREIVGYMESGEAEYLRRGTFSLSENWWYLYLCAGIGLALMGVSVFVYRRRDLERAGDLMATRKLEPVFLVLYAVAFATVGQYFFMAMLGLNENYILLAAALAVGWFSGRMLLKRSTRVFGLKSWLGLAALTAVLSLTIVATHYDIFGIETRIPKAEEVESVTISQGLYYDEDRKAVLAEPEDIENAIFIHEKALECRLKGNEFIYEGQKMGAKDLPEGVDWSQVSETAFLVLEYRLKDGSSMTRSYYIWGHEEEGKLLRQYLSQLKVVTGFDDLYYSPVDRFYIDDYTVEENYLTREDMEALLDAIEADCAAGTLAQDPELHPLVYVLEYPYRGETGRLHSYWLSINMSGMNLHLSVYSDSENTLKWITDRSIDQIILQLHSN